MNPQKPEQSDQALWHRFTDSVHDATCQIDPDVLAAYLDGKANAAEVANVEHALANDQSLLDMAIALRQVNEFLGREAEPSLPASVLAAAKTLVPGPTLTRRHKADPHVVWRWSDRLRWAAAAVVFMAVGVMGYIVGQDTYRYQALTRSALTAAADTLVGLDDDEPAILVLGFAAGGAS